MKSVDLFEQWVNTIAGVYESLQPLNEQEEVGREYQHIEDLTYIYGPQGALKAINRLQQIAQDSSHLEVKWDGSPAITFGRNAKGQFHLGDKYAREYLTTPKALYDYVTRKGSSESRVEFARVMMSLFKYYEQATPKDYRGFLECGLMYPTSQQPKPKEVNGVYTFKPNTVIYSVAADSELGKRIGQSATAAAATGYFDDLPGLGAQRQAVGDRYKPINSPQVVIIPPTFTNTQVKLPQQQLKRLEQYVKQNAALITDFITPSAEWTASFKKNPAKAVSEWRAAIYKYVNTQVDSPESLSNLGSNIVSWAQTDPILKSAGRREIAINDFKNKKAGMTATFKVVGEIMKLKNTVLNQIEKPTLASMGISAQLPTGYGSGEGFVSDPEGGVQPLKLVNRGGFTAANRQQGAIGAARSAELGNKAMSALKEAKRNKGTAVVGWGRGMGHKGHMFLAESVISYADKIGATPFFYVSETVGRDDPLTPQEKLAIYRKVFPNYKGIFKTGKTPVQILTDIYQAGYTDCVFIVGEDNKAAFQFLAKPTKSTGELPVPFDSVKVMSRQETGSKTSGLAGPRATPMREILKNPDATQDQKFAVWRKAMPDALSDEQVLKIMRLVAKRLGATVSEAENPATGGANAGLGAQSAIPGTPSDLQPHPSRRDIKRQQRRDMRIRQFMGRR